MATLGSFAFGLSLPRKAALHLSRGATKLAGKDHACLNIDYLS